jgi:hypothetical protein
MEGENVKSVKDPNLLSDSDEFDAQGTTTSIVPDKLDKHFTAIETDPDNISISLGEDDFSSDENAVNSESDEDNGDVIDVNDKLKLLTDEQFAKLKKKDWMQDFTRWDLDADLKMDASNSSAQQEAQNVKQRQQRCGIVIWTTCLQLVYTLIYIMMIYTRFHTKTSFILSQDFEDVMLNFKSPLVSHIDHLDNCFAELAKLDLELSRRQAVLIC